MRYRTLLENRRSIRDFKNQSLKHEMAMELMSYVEDLKGPLDDIDFHISFINNGFEKGHHLDGKVGYGGFPVKAPNYIAFISEEKPGYLQNSSYILEKIVLKAIEMEIGTCWLSVIKDDLDLRTNLSITEKGKLVAFIALGHPQGHVPFTPTSTSTRVPLNEFIFNGIWGQKPMVEELESRGLTNALYHIRMAPSWQNRQPWKLILDSDKLILTVGNNAMEDKDLLIDAGIMMLYMEEILKEEGYPVSWDALLEGKDNLYEKHKIPSEQHIVGALRL
ncbi:nitroreductase family protein [Alkaliphilus peptidifermentans]|uniref:Nitroreductase n=1 Tax=Alkaliphilus peptidifermentans DSM 18978 TaxID=1120976 RepID=A0A1G5FL53_9FIRM|nr:nitroreductase family protein [Alkaliphilus peptidifermentans]SCY39986.1 Nitroreductase [Alkaliphilus peptidifermentans DSM 18978]